jgi:hypothetical protein
MSNGVNDIITGANKLFNAPWSSPVMFSDPGQDAFLPELAVDSQGNATAVWQRSNGVNSIIQTATEPFGGAWSSPLNITPPGQDASQPDVSVDSRGNIVIIWQRSNGINTIIQVVMKPFGQSWSETVDISALGENGTSAHVVQDNRGDAVAVWIETAGSDVVAQSSFGVELFPLPPSPPLPPSNFIGVISKNKFLNKTEYILQATWSASPSANVIFYRIYKNNKVVDTISANSPLVFKTCLPSKNSVKEYEIAAVNSDNLESNHLKLKIVQ